MKILSQACPALANFLGELGVEKTQKVVTELGIQFPYGARMVMINFNQVETFGAELLRLGTERPSPQGNK